MATYTPPARRNTTIIANVFYLITIPFLVLVLAGNTTKNSSILSDVWFFKLDVSHIIPISVENSSLLNSVARSLGLHDYYQVGIWNFCEGYNDEGITDCSDPKPFFWFNPVEVLVNELLAGAKIALPSQVITILHLLQLGSNIMYVFFIVGAVLNFILLFITPLAIRSRLWTIPITILAFVSGLIISVAAIIATVISVAAKIALTAQDQLNISADIGIKMFAFMWIAAIGTDLAFLLHAAMGCCCAPRRNSDNNNEDASQVSVSEKRGSMASFVRRRKPTTASSHAASTSQVAS